MPELRSDRVFVYRCRKERIGILQVAYIVIERVFAYFIAQRFVIIVEFVEAYECSHVDKEVFDEMFVQGMVFDRMSLHDILIDDQIEVVLKYLSLYIFTLVKCLGKSAIQKEIDFFIPLPWE